ncbi:MAG TPA: aldehyde dehydrogenase family protein [Candidatus Thermoplasmatota archaeon]|nr:aldehyde dehydrogenase family protein [Candidatus Thermoplasmatota archaeon]
MQLKLEPPTSDGVRKYRAFIDGQWVESSDGQWIDVTDPATGALVGQVPSLTKADVLKAIDAAHGARRKIRDIPAIARIEIMERAKHILEANRSLLVDLVVAESGKPINVAKGEVKATIERLALTSQEARTMHGEFIPGDWVEDTKAKFAIVRRQPRGVVAAITPFNYPLFIAAAKVVPALVAGNTVVVKPSTETPLSMLFFAKAMEEAGLPAGALNIVTGRGREIGDTIAESTKVDMISFTGSTAIGERIAQKAGMKHLALELGGKGAALVLDDANLDLAAREVARGGLRFQGQRCDAVARVLVDAKVADAFVEKLLKEVAKYPMGDTRDEKTAIGPLIKPAAVKFALGLIDDARTKGAKLLTGGGARDNYLEPTVLDGVTLDMRVAWEEQFAPILPIIRVEGGVEEMLEIANRSEYGLDSAVFTNDVNRAWGVAKRLEDGAVTINGYPAHGVGHFPFGGNKRSGMGREGINASLEEMTRVQTIVMSLPPLDDPYHW